MKKIIIALIGIFILMPFGVNADNVCSYRTIEMYREKLKDFTYTLEKGERLDMNGDKSPGYYKLVYSGLPDNMEFVVITSEGFNSSNFNSEFLLKGGVYEFRFYANDCDNVIKTYNIKTPTYNEDCGSKCENIWFDGTYEINVDNDDENNTKISKKLLIVLVSLIIIFFIVIFGTKIIKRGGIKLKKITIFIFAFIISMISVNAEVTCDPSNEHYNPRQWIGTIQDNNDKRLVYEISYTEIKDNKYHLYGYALVTNTNNIMREEGSSSEHPITSIELRAAQNDKDLNDEKKYIKLEVNYLQGDNGSNLNGAHYFNIAYWNCFRYSDSNKECPNCCGGGNANFIQGGFEAILDLTDEKIETGDYYLYYKVTSQVSKSISDLNKWDKLAVADIIAGSTANNSSKEVEIKSDNGIRKVKIKENSTQAQMQVSQGRLIGASGFFCDSPVIKDSLKSETKYIKGISYDISGQLIDTYRGPNEGAFYNHIIPLKVSSSNISNGTQLNSSTAYAPSSWLKLIGSVVISIKADQCPPNTCCYTAKKGDSYDSSLSGKDKVTKDGKALYKCKNEGITVEKAKECTEFESCDVACDPKTSPGCCFNADGSYIKNGKEDDLNKFSCPGEFDEETQKCSVDVVSCTPPDVVDCSDTVVQATCSPTGVKSATFEEKQGEFKNCTLNENQESGFVFLKNNYCIAGCADTLTLDLPGTKVAKSGSYFKLDQYAPHIETKRSCVAEIHAANFKADLEAAKGDMINSYNSLQDYKKFKEALPDSATTTQGADHEYGSYPLTSNTLLCTDIYNSNNYSDYDMYIYYNCYNGYVYQINYSETCDSAQKGYCTYDGYKVVRSTPQTCQTYTTSWSVSAYSLPNGTSDSIFSTTGGTYGQTSNGENGCIVFGEDQKRLEDVKKDVDNKITEYERKYNEAVSYYEKIINKFSECSSWFSGDTKSKYEVSPNEKFDYMDMQDGDYKYVTNQDQMTKNGEAKTTKEAFWKDGSGIDENKYEGGNYEENAIPEKIFINDCSNAGDTCDNNDGDYRDFYTYSNVRIDYEASYDYSLPQLYTTIPTGKIVAAGNENTLKLPINSVPIHLRTPAKTDDYTLELSELVDSLREGAGKYKKDTYLDRIQGKNGKDSLFESSDLTFKCKYTVYNDIYEPEHDNYFYRVVNMNDINPNKRDLGYNWSDQKGTIVQDRMKETATNYQKLTNGLTLNDGSVADKFSFRLTPKIMSAIREYNNYKSMKQTGSTSSDGNGYADWTLKCEDNGKNDYYCTSSFLTCLASSGGNCVNTVPTDIANSFNIDYNYYSSGSLDKNRTILRDKLKALNAGGY